MRFAHKLASIINGLAVALAVLAGLAAAPDVMASLSNERLLLASDCVDTCEEGTKEGTAIPGTFYEPCKDSKGSCTKKDAAATNYSCNGCDPKPVMDGETITGCQVSCTGKSIRPVILD